MKEMHIAHTRSEIGQRGEEMSEEGRERQLVWTGLRRGDDMTVT